MKKLTLILAALVALFPLTGKAQTTATPVVNKTTFKLTYPTSEQFTAANATRYLYDQGPYGNVAQGGQKAWVDTLARQLIGTSYPASPASVQWGDYYAGLANNHYIFYTDGPIGYQGSNAQGYARFDRPEYGHSISLNGAWTEGGGVLTAPFVRVYPTFNTYNGLTSGGYPDVVNNGYFAGAMTKAGNTGDLYLLNNQTMAPNTRGWTNISTRRAFAFYPQPSAVFTGGYDPIEYSAQWGTPPPAYAGEMAFGSDGKFYGFSNGAWRAFTLSGDASAFQPLDSDLTALAALSTTAYGRSFNTLADASAARSYIGLGDYVKTINGQSGDLYGPNLIDGQVITPSGVQTNYLYSENTIEALSTIYARGGLEVSGTTNVENLVSSGQISANVIDASQEINTQGSMSVGGSLTVSNIYCDGSIYGYLDAGAITSGVLDPDRIPDNAKISGLWSGPYGGYMLSAGDGELYVNGISSVVFDSTTSQNGFLNGLFAIADANTGQVNTGQALSIQPKNTGDGTPSKLYFYTDFYVDQNGNALFSQVSATSLLVNGGLMISNNRDYYSGTGNLLIDYNGTGYFNNLYSNGGVNFDSGTIYSNGGGDLSVGSLIAYGGGSFTGLSVDGGATNLDGGAIYTDGYGTLYANNIYGSSFYGSGSVNVSYLNGNGSGVSNINASNITTGTLAAARLPQPVVQSWDGTTNVTVAASTDILLLTVAPTASRVVTLPAASSRPANSTLRLDFGKNIAGPNAVTITVVRAGNDLFNSATALSNNGTSIVPSNFGGFYYTLISDGVSRWNNASGLLPDGFGGVKVVQYNFGTSLIDGGNKLIGLSYNYPIVWNNASDVNFYSAGASVGLRPSSTTALEVDNGALGNYRDLRLRGLLVDSTLTPAGTTGAVTINKTAGSVRVPAGQDTVVVTNNLVTASSYVFVTQASADATAYVKYVVPAAGSFTVKLGAAASAETEERFFVVNP